MKLNISFRGLLKSCNYACSYCPMAMQTETKDEKEQDRKSLKSFVDWITFNSSVQFRILITPWGEALVRRWYREKLVELSHLEHVEQITVQTNLSRNPSWLREANLNKVTLWITYHPDQVRQEKFLLQLKMLDDMNASYTVGMVGKEQFSEEIKTMRDLIPKNRYFWINAYQPGIHQYSEPLVKAFNKVDPLFWLNYKSISSQGKSCSAGEDSLFVDGFGNIKRCHFVEKKLTHIYDPNWKNILKPRKCPNAKCNCYIGYIHLDELNVKNYYGEQKLARIPVDYQK